ncbi:hypothetical protein BDQ17DRAFT_1328606 [Cyathus striatus]|nr:hypothetical protein BDQ17DRAFT_1328606 [Cyathus striatus]
MPELVEGKAHYLTTLWALEEYGTKPYNYAVQGLWGDFTNVEAIDRGIETGLVQQLTSACRLKHGTSGIQTPLIGKQLQLTSRNRTPIPISSLRLKGVYYSVRALILDLGELWLRIYSRNGWRRKFSVGLAIDCTDFVVAFVSLDNLFQPLWATSRARLGPEPPDVYTSAIRGANKMWFGVGSYTISEILFSAGIPACAYEQDVFKNPSRTARLCEAYWCLAHRAEKLLP